MRARLLLRSLAKGAWPPVLLASLAGWAAVGFAGRWAGLPAICGAMPGLELTGGLAQLGTFFVLNPPASLLVPWLLMLLAMMPPLLVQPMTHLWNRSFRRRRLWSIALFALGYVSVWTLAGAGLIVLSLGLKMSVPAAMSFWCAVALALLWQIAPAKQFFLNRCHRLPVVAAFGFAAGRDCVRCGLEAGLWCVGACWALMLVPLAADSGHLLAMAAVSLVMTLERLAPPRSLHWQAPWNGVRLLWA